MDAVAGSLGLHIAGEIILVFTERGTNATIFPRIGIFLRLHAANPLLNQSTRLLVIGVNIAGEGKREITRIAEKLLEDLERTVIVEFLHILAVDQYGAVRVVGSHHRDGVAPDSFRVLLLVRKLLIEETEQCLKRIFVFANSRKMEVVELEQRLKILDA